MISGFALRGGGRTFYLRDLSSSRKSSLDLRGLELYERLSCTWPEVPEPRGVESPIPLYMLNENQLIIGLEWIITQIGMVGNTSQ